MHHLLPPWYRLAARAAAGLAAGTLLAGAFPESAAAQFPQWATFPLPYVDARVLPRGVLQVGFLPSYAHYDSRFDSRGTIQPLGAYFSSDTTGSNLFPSVLGAERAVGNLIGNSQYRMNLGRLKLPLDADVRRFPFDFSLGLTSRITLGIRLPQVRTRVQGVMSLDSSTANVGFNQAAAAAGNAQGAAQIQLLLAQLQAAKAQLETRINQGSYGCPTSQQCDAARLLVGNAEAAYGALLAITGAPGSGSPVPPVAPLASSPAGQLLQAMLASLAAQLQSFGVGPVTATLALPTVPLRQADLTTILTAQEFGYGLSPLATVRWSRLGDAEAFVRWGALQGDRVRAVLTGTVRLPTGTRDSPQHAFDLGTGDRQTDLEGGLEFAVQPGRLGVSGTVLYTYQLADRLAMRWTAPERPVQLAALEYPTERHLGSVFRAALYPSLTLSEGFRVYASAYYWRKAQDRYSLAPGVDPLPITPSPDEVARGTAGRSLSLGGGIAYRAVRVRRDSVATETGLPVEAGLSYQVAFSGSDGLVPKSTMLQLYLRLAHRLFGKPEP